MRPTVVAFLAAPLALGLLATAACAQADRLDRTAPGLVLETGARTAACDALVFTPDGRYLAAAGDDKVVRIWKVTDAGLDPAGVQVLRWMAWREQRGSIYALALSPDRDARSVAVAGYGMRVGSGSVAILDRATGQVKQLLDEPQATRSEVWALSFSPSGNRVAYGRSDGTAWVWNLKGKANDVEQAGKHREPAKDQLNKVVLAEFLDEQTLVTVAADGDVLRWDLARPGTPVGRRLQFQKLGFLRQAALSPDRKRIAAVGIAARRVEILPLDGGATTVIEDLPRTHYPHCLAWDRAGNRLAVGTRGIPENLTFAKETDGKVFVYDLRRNPPLPTAGPDVPRYAEVLAFHPDGERLAIAGGDNHEVFLWKLAPLQRLGEIAGPGRALYGVGFSKDGKRVGFREQRATDPDHPNRRAKGPWRVFDLDRRALVPAKDFAAVEPLDTLGGWKVEFDRDKAALWYVVTPQNKRWELPWDEPRDGLPRCFTFFKPKGGPVRLAVGHYWGVSVFDLDPQAAPRRRRLMIGHQGEVTAVAPRDDGAVLVTASRDETVCFWGLADWPAQAELGAKFSERQGKLVVDAVDPGSPAWEAGLSKDDEVVLLVVDRNRLFDLGKVVDKDGKPKYGPAVGKAGDCLEPLKAPVPGKELYFGWRTPKGEIKESQTTVRQRPVLRFFPLTNGEWMLWRWRDYYYDTSNRGDAYIGWQVNGEKEVDTPAFYPAEQFRRRFHDPAKVAEAVARMTYEPEQVNLARLEPPELKLESADRVRDADLEVKLSVRPRGNAEEQTVREVVLWVNDHRFRAWRAEEDSFPRGWQKKDDGSYETTTTVPLTVLRRGGNTLSLRSYNHEWVRGDPTQPSRYVACEAAPVPPRLFGVAVGNDKYQQVKPSPARNLLFSEADAESMKEVWERQGGRQYADAKVVALLGRNATRENILGALAQLRTEVRPDDRLVLFLSGHGYAKKVKENVFEPGSFAFVCPTFDLADPARTGVTSKDFYEALVALPCRKLVLLDACHAGGSSDLVRELTPENVGPIILSACQFTQEATEDERLEGHGVFTKAILDAVEEFFAQADADGNGSLEGRELAAYVGRRVPELVQKFRLPPQDPLVFPPRLDTAAEGPVPVARKTR